MIHIFVNIIYYNIMQLCVLGNDIDTINNPLNSVQSVNSTVNENKLTYTISF